MKKKLPVDISDLGLTPRETKFVCEYITNGYNAEAAAKEAGLLARDAGRVAIRLHCAHLLQTDKIKAAIQRTRESFVEPYRDIHYAKIQEVLEVRAFYDPADFFNPDGSTKELDEIPPKLRYAIDGVEELWSMGKNGINIRTVKFKLADRDKARAELRALHEVKEKEKNTDAETKRSEILNMIEAFDRGKIAATEHKAIDSKSSGEPIPATLLAQKIKEGEYVVKKEGN